jgi:hypothetical protein
MNARSFSIVVNGGVEDDPFHGVEDDPFHS